jgi:hypothetical protein
MTEYEPTLRYQNRYHMIESALTRLTFM